MKKKIIAVAVTLCIAITPMISIAGPNDYNHEESSKIYKNTDINALKAKAAILMDLDSGRVLFSKEEHQKLPIASITKVMTMLIIFDNLESKKISLKDMVPVTVDAESMGGSEAYLKVGESFSVNDMLKAIIIHSSNDVCVAMADYVAGSESVFVSLMNNRAKALGLKNTNFADCTGLAEEGHFSSAYDISLMAKELITKYPKVMEYSKIWMDTFRDGKFRLDNTNMLVKYYNGTTGLKTGFTSMAGYCLTATAQRGDKHFISVVLGTPDSNTRFAESRKLLDIGFSNYNKVQVVKKVDDTGLISIDKGKLKSIGTHPLKDLSVMLKDDEVSKIKKEIVLDKSITAPIEKGTKVGEIIIKIDGKEIVKTQIVTNEKVEKASFLILIIRKIASWFGLSA